MHQFLMHMHIRKRDECIAAFMRIFYALSIHSSLKSLAEKIYQFSKKICLRLKKAFQFRFGYLYIYSTSNWFYILSSEVLFIGKICEKKLTFQNCDLQNFFDSRSQYGMQHKVLLLPIAPGSPRFNGFEHMPSCSWVKGTQDWEFFDSDFGFCVISLLVMSKY